ncbi:hypothetical protein Q1M64_14760 (plasmid) [Sinorhizobium meliloti]|nr:hypothetical protein Q1M64_14760 [Sinorhizobium meliloti]
MGADEISSSRQTGECLLLDLAGLVARSWRQGFAGPVAVPARVARSLANSQAPLSLSIREPEGYAFYALYPESYLEAAAGSGLPADTVVIGLRSIGTTLSAIVAASIGAAPPVTLRPIGDPFQRRLAVASQLAERLLRDRAANFAIVDEGPGLSGSSFGCVADWLEDHGVSGRRIHFFPRPQGRAWTAILRPSSRALGGEAAQCHRRRRSPDQAVQLCAPPRRLDRPSRRPAREAARRRLSRLMAQDASRRSLASRGRQVRTPEIPGAHRRRSMARQVCGTRRRWAAKARQGPPPRRCRLHAPRSPDCAMAFWFRNGFPRG